MQKKKKSDRGTWVIMSILKIWCMKSFFMNNLCKFMT